MAGQIPRSGCRGCSLVVQRALVIGLGSALVLGTVWLYQPRALARESLEEYARRRVERSKSAANRENGVLLQAAVEVRSTWTDAEILIHWTLDYNGPRPPLIILKPTLEAPVSTQSSVIFYPMAAGNDDLPVPFHAPTSVRPIVSGKEHFLTLKQGEAGHGILTVKVSQLRAEMRRRWPEQFGKVGPGLLYVQLCHAPMDRGEMANLDAWTGSLATELIPVPLDKLKLD